ncbi:Transmembrane protein 62 [Fasciola gigantica]|uniref:Transmembrane protein 62 n=1 Tax=Fasciola gigantica TaxID=46835 RepID=A0A504ZB46_FASGI|nr:Transmembrane protein 62 [Fasciola gigantica]
MDYRFSKSVDETPNSVWPIVLVTNPKDANFLMPEKEPVNRISQSDHIRVLVWSNSTIKNVSLWIDDVYVGQAKQAASIFANAGPSPLYVLPWNPSELQDGSTLRVKVVDAAGNKRIITQPISVAGIPRRQFTYISQWILRSQIPLNLSVVFYMSWLFVFMVLVIPRCFGDNWLQFSRNKPSFFRGLYRFSHETALVGPVLVFLLYELVGPIFLGFLIPGHFGALFSFGIVIAGTFVREGLTYFCELLQLWVFFLFVIVIGIRSFAQQQPISRRHTCAVPTDLFTCTIIFTTFQFILILTTICLPYGFSAVCLSPGRLMPLAVSWYLAYRVSRLSFSREIRTATSRLLSNDGASVQSRSHETAALSMSHSP